jgi:hypothetical protein
MGVQQVPVDRHTWGVGHSPQLRVAPHSSEAVPQLRPSSLQVFGWQQRLLLHAPPLAQGPQSSWLPQPSLTAPHSAPAAAQVLGWQQRLLLQTP